MIDQWCCVTDPPRPPTYIAPASRWPLLAPGARSLSNSPISCCHSQQHHLSAQIDSEAPHRPMPEYKTKPNQIRSLRLPRPIVFTRSRPLNALSTTPRIFWIFLVHVAKISKCSISVSSIHGNTYSNLDLKRKIQNRGSLTCLSACVGATILIA